MGLKWAQYWSVPGNRTKRGSGSKTKPTGPPSSKWWIPEPEWSYLKCLTGGSSQKSMDAYPPGKRLTVRLSQRKISQIFFLWYMIIFCSLSLHDRWQQSSRHQDLQNFHSGVQRPRQIRDGWLSVPGWLRQRKPSEDGEDLGREGNEEPNENTQRRAGLPRTHIAQVHFILVWSGTQLYFSFTIKYESAFFHKHTIKGCISLTWSPAPRAELCIYRECDLGLFTIKFFFGL